MEEFNSCCMYHIPIVIIMGGSTIHLVGVEVGGEWCIYQTLIGSFLRGIYRCSK